MESNTELVKKAFLEAYNGIDMAMAQKFGDHSVQAEVVMGVAAPIAAEIYRQMTKTIIVTVKDKRCTIRNAEQLRDVMVYAGYRGVVIAGDVEYEFPIEDDPVQVVIEENAEDK